MADTKNTKTEVGIIGQTYQNRKTKKIGTLESRNEKCKTLCMVDPDGKTFNIVYSTFKSDWRKHGDDATTTKSTETKKPEVKDAPTKNTKTEESKSETKTRGRKSIVSAEDRVKATLAVKSTVEEAIEKSKLPLKVKTLSKGAIAVKYNRRTSFEIWPHPDRNTYAFISNAKVQFSDKSVSYTRKDGWILKNRYEVKNLNTSVKEMLAAVKDDVLKAEEKNTKKEGK